MKAVKRSVLTLTILSVLFAQVQPTLAQDWNYQPAYGVGYQQAYPVGYPDPYQQRKHETLKKVLIGGALVGLGFLAGRLTAPKPNYNNGYPGPQFQPQSHHHGPHPALYQSYRGPRF